MAHYTINSIAEFLAINNHTHTDWQFALDAGFTNIIDESLLDAVNLLSYTTPLPKEGGGFYSDEDIVYGRARAWFGNTHSPWYELSGNQNFQTVKIVDEDGTVIITDSDTLNMQ